MKLSCDRTVGSAQATVGLQASIFDPPLQTVTVSCGPDSLSGLRSETINVPVNAGWANVTAFVVIDASGQSGQVGGGALPLKTTEKGATLVIR